MAKPPQRKTTLVINASVWLKDEERFTVSKNLDHTPRPGEILEVEGEL